ncbi:hypothetical protein DEDE109153_08700 [Deinococcus deserti]
MIAPNDPTDLPADRPESCIGCVTFFVAFGITPIPAAYSLWGAWDGWADAHVRHGQHRPYGELVCVLVPMAS